MHDPGMIFIGFLLDEVRGSERKISMKHFDYTNYLPVLFCTYTIALVQSAVYYCPVLCSPPFGIPDRSSAVSFD